MLALAIIGLCFSSYLGCLLLVNVNRIDLLALQGSIIWGILGALYLWLFSLVVVIKYKR